MKRPSIRHLAAVGALALIAIAPAAACGSEPVSPLPIQPGTATPSQTASPSAVESTPPANAPPSAQNPPAVQRSKTSTPRPTGPTPSCMGAIRYDVDLQNTELALLKSMCFATGAVLRLQGIGPGLVTVEPASLVSQSYEAGVVDIRFVRRGTVTVNIPQDEQTYTVTVVIR
ncbi:hypothetical protein Prum_074950 [Phytohabitans rumicis]|uniref:Lipoprotein n=2 Tax=Phytohabitans rumicis TaxID=1076125 RepID=A0A6V8L9E3_9ACTN|nr:hypothetical protein Prum_074950 [Phytohabitans rumicis]